MQVKTRLKISANLLEKEDPGNRGSEQGREPVTGICYSIVARTSASVLLTYCNSLKLQLSPQTFSEDSGNKSSLHSKEN